MRTRTGRGTGVGSIMSKRDAGIATAGGKVHPQAAGAWSGPKRRGGHGWREKVAGPSGRERERIVRVGLVGLCPRLSSLGRGRVRPTSVGSTGGGEDGADADAGAEGRVPVQGPRLTGGCRVPWRDALSQAQTVGGCRRGERSWLEMDANRWGREREVPYRRCSHSALSSMCPDNDQVEVYGYTYKMISAEDILSRSA